MITEEMLNHIAENKNLLSEKKIIKFLVQSLNLSVTEFAANADKKEILNLHNVPKDEQDEFISQHLTTDKQTLIEGIYIPTALIYDLVYPTEMLTEELISILTASTESNKKGVFASIKLHTNSIELLIYHRKSNKGTSFSFEESERTMLNTITAIPLADLQSYKRVEISYTRFLDILLDMYYRYLNISASTINTSTGSNAIVVRNQSTRQIVEDAELSSILEVKINKNNNAIDNMKFIPHTKELVIKYNPSKNIKQVDFVLGTNIVTSPKFEFFYKLDGEESFGYRVDSNLCIIVSVLPTKHISTIEVRRITKPISVLNPEYDINNDTVYEENMSKFLLEYVLKINKKIKTTDLVNIDLFNILYRNYLPSLDMRSTEYKYYLTNIGIYKK